MENKENQNTEISLDEVLSSIKKMVIDETPPVLDLTEMISDDGSIVSISKNKSEQKKENEMSSFLKLIQEDTPISTSPITDDITGKTTDKSISSLINKTASRETIQNDILQDLIKEAITPILKEWIDKNMPNIVEKLIVTEVRNFLRKK
ncbi:MAG: DUF2497 domain-containing protein [Alphaproteobacteria bacterium]|nr:DUF2497 domain-containing protein [Alphaproteobacteria bacterium]